MTFFSWVTFTPVAHTSSAIGSSYSHPADQSTTREVLPSTNNFIEQYGLYTWQSSPHQVFPQVLDLKLEHRTEVAHLVLQAKPDIDLPEVEIYIGDSDNGPLGYEDDGIGSRSSSLKYRLAGSAKALMPRVLSTIECFGIGTHVRLVFRRPSTSPVAMGSVGFD